MTAFLTGYASVWLMLAVKKLAVVEADVAEAAEWYDALQPGLGPRFISSLQALDRVLSSNPYRFSIRFGDIRRLNMRDFPYAIFFSVQDDSVIVLAVLHMRRDTRELLQRRRRLI